VRDFIVRKIRKKELFDYCQNVCTLILLIYVSHREPAF